MVQDNFERILAYVLANIPAEIGLFNGKAGIALIYILLARREGNGMCELIADMYLEQIWNTCTYDTPLSFARGLTGIGWLCEYLYQNQMTVGNPDEILKDVDEVVNMINPLKIKDLSFDNGVIGIFVYIFARVIGCKLRGMPIPFDEQLLNDVVKVVNDNSNKDLLCQKGIAYIYNLNVTGTQLTKRNLIELIKASTYSNSYICVCLEKLLNDDKLLQ